MSQSFTDDVYAAAHTAATDLQNIENNFAALKSTFSGAASPANTEAGMLWYDIDAGTSNQGVLKLRDDDDATWFGVMHADETHKIWVWRDSALDGWAVDAASATDMVLSLKGGATYVTGATTAGSWTLPDHALTVAEMAAHTHGSGGTHGHTAKYWISSGGASTIDRRTVGNYEERDQNIISAGAHEHTSVGGGGSHNHGSTYRPASAVGTLQYLDI